MYLSVQLLFNSLALFVYGSIYLLFNKCWKEIPLLSLFIKFLALLTNYLKHITLLKHQKEELVKMNKIEYMN